jgi:hypothetical protein
VDNATRLGILTVASAGNSADKPYANGTPAAAETALSVAQTAVPSANLALMQIVAPANIVGQLPGRLPALVGAADLGDRGTGAVWRRRRRQPARL